MNRAKHFQWLSRVNDGDADERGLIRSRNAILIARACVPCGGHNSLIVCKSAFLNHYPVGKRSERFKHKRTSDANVKVVPRRVVSSISMGAVGAACWAVPSPQLLHWSWSVSGFASLGKRRLGESQLRHHFLPDPSRHFCRWSCSHPRGNLFMTKRFRCQPSARVLLSPLRSQSPQHHQGQPNHNHARRPRHPIPQP